MKYIPRWSKSRLSILLLFLLVLFVQERCPKQYNDLGAYSAYFEVNGEPLHIDWRSDMEITGDTLVLHMIGHGEAGENHVKYIIGDFHGDGKYDMASDTLTRCLFFTYERQGYDTITYQTHYSYDDLHDSIVGPTYLYVLEYDPAANAFKAVFEAHLADTTGHIVHITHGRINTVIHQNPY